MPNIESCKALLALDKANALVPHGIGGHGRACLEWAIGEIERLRRVESAAIEWRRSLEDDGWSKDAIESGICRPGMRQLMLLVEPR